MIFTEKTKSPDVDISDLENKINKQIFKIYGFDNQDDIDFIEKGWTATRNVDATLKGIL